MNPLSTLFNKYKIGYNTMNPLSVAGFGFVPKTTQLPNDSGSYESVTPSTAPLFPTPTGAPVPIKKPTSQPSPAPTPVSSKTTAPLDYSKYTNPATGVPYTPTEYADMMAKRATAGSIPTYAGNALTKPDQTAEQLRKTAGDINVVRNDMATGAVDPYKVASKSGVQYTPAQLSAIEKAYAGIYDPALQDVFAKLETKQKEDAAALALKADLEKMAKEHEYAIELKKTPTASESAALSSLDGSISTYVKGANPIVDGWVQRLNQSGQDINAAIPGVKNQGLRNAVMIGLNATKSENAKNAGTMDDINTINTMLVNPKLENISGFVDQTTGGMFGQAKTAKTQYNQIVGALQLAKAGQIKGQGQISDYERKVLKEASAAIDRGMSDEEFRKALIKLKGALQTSSGLEAKVKITDPTTGKSDIQNLNTQEISGFISDGAIIEYLE